MKTLGCTSTLALSLVLSIGLSGCGGGSSDSASNTNGKGSGTTKTVTFSGRAVDGYISGATACLDTNVNGVCDSGEPTASTNTDGKFTFTNVTVDSGKLIPIIVKGGTDISTNKPFKGTISSIVNTEDMTKNKTVVTSPLTDLVTTKFIASKDKSLASLSQIKNNVASSLNISVEKINSDPMKDKDVFAKAQEVQQIKKLILTAATKSNGGSINADELAKNVREAVATSVESNADLNTTDVIKKLKVVQPTVTIPVNETNFIANQITEIKKTLAIMVTNTTVTTNTLNQQQSNLDTTVESASKRIKEATDDSVITVVTVKQVTKTEPVKPTKPVATPVATTLATPPVVPTL